MAEREIQLTFAPESRTQLSDASWCARWAREALQDGRYQLAAELVDLARRAAAANDGTAALLARTRAVPLIGETRQEIPTRPDARSHAPQTCAYAERVEVRYLAGDSETVPGQRCGQPIAWAPGVVAFDGEAPTRAGWYHLDPEITDHEPELP